MSLTFIILGPLVFSAIAGFFVWDRHQLCKAEIEGSLRKYHATDIKITLDLFDYDRDTLTYDVEYRDRLGKLRTNRCKVSSLASPADEAIYWVDPITPPDA